MRLGPLSFSTSGKCSAMFSPLTSVARRKGRCGDLELGESLGVARACVEAHIVSIEAQVVSDAGEREEVPIEGHRGTEDPHGRVLASVSD